MIDALKVAMLTPRESDVISRLANSQTIPAIAADLGISPKTVEFHKANACRLIGLRGSDYAGIARFAIRARLITP